MSTEYRVVWQREGKVQMVKQYRNQRNAQKRYDLLTSPEPWKVLGYEADDYVCCPGGAAYECGCEGLTRREQTEKIRSKSPLLYARIETREVTAWKQ